MSFSVDRYLVSYASNLNRYANAAEANNNSAGVPNQVTITEKEKTSLARLLQGKKENQGKTFNDFCVTSSSEDKGGHGGNLKVRCKNQEGSPIHLFLKPLNNRELANYKYLKALRDNPNNSLNVDDLTKYMVCAYGSIKLAGKEYLVMHDASMNENGRKKTTLCDIKLAGWVEGIHPIASEEELEYTGDEKGTLDFAQMYLGSATAPHFMVASGPKYGRLFNYKDSASNLKQSLKGKGSLQLIDLKEQLLKMQKALQSNRVALIGSSILINWDEDLNSFEALLIDPAHIQANPEDINYTNIVANVLNTKQVFTGKDLEYKKRVESNQIAIKAIIDVVEAEIEYEASDECSLVPNSNDVTDCDEN